MEIPKTCDWVTARAKCSLASAFESLRETVDSDLKARQSARKHGPTFLLNVIADTKFLVVREYGDGDRSSVVFERVPHGIEVREGAHERKVLFTAKPFLNEAGHCQLIVDDTPYEFWQVSRKALHDLFFELWD